MENLDFGFVINLIFVTWLVVSENLNHTCYECSTEEKLPSDKLRKNRGHTKYLFYLGIIGAGLFLFFPIFLLISPKT